MIARTKGQKSEEEEEEEEKEEYRCCSLNDGEICLKRILMVIPKLKYDSK
jgi:hypothetical protein